MQGNYGYNFRSPRVDIHQFSMVPRADIPRSSFRMEHSHKTTFNLGDLIPVYIQEILPGDSFNTDMTVFARLATPLYPIMDNLELESWFFFVPCRLLWTNWPQFMGEQKNPADSISFTIPQIVSPTGGFPQFSLYDYMGLPCSGQTLAGNTISVSALPFRAYNLIYNEWFRDQNLTNSGALGSGGGVVFCSADAGPDPSTFYTVRKLAKRHDYFTSCLPWTQKGGVAVTLPLGTSATVRTNSTALVTGAQTAINFTQAGGGATVSGLALGLGASGVGGQTSLAATFSTGVYPNNLYADLSTATSATINAIRLAFQTQRLLERDARGGTRYVEMILSHFGVRSPDYRLMRPEYLGGGRSMINVAPVPQTTATGLTGGSSPLGTLSAAAMVQGRHSWRQAFTEHGYVLGLVGVRNDKIYQQGIRKLWKRTTRYDFYLPVFAGLGEQAVANYEIYSDGSANDSLTFGFQERWAEYRYHPSYTSAEFRSTNATPLDAWHLAQRFTSLPALNDTFIQEDIGTTAQRVFAAGALTDKQQLIADFFFKEICARPMPMYSVPGLVDHF